jgi:hypothetical protein
MGLPQLFRFSESWIIRTRERVFGMILLFNVREPFVREGFSGKEPGWHFL